MSIFNIISSNNQKKRYINFKSLKSNKYIIINTLPLNTQDCLISGTLSPEQEITQIQNLQDNYQYNKEIIIYGKNSTDETVDNKYNQLINLGFTNVFIYRGGLFEWALLQEIYGIDEFPTTKKIINPLVWSLDYIMQIENKQNTLMKLLFS